MKKINLLLLNDKDLYDLYHEILEHDKNKLPPCGLLAHIHEDQRRVYVEASIEKTKYIILREIARRWATAFQ